MDSFSIMVSSIETSCELIIECVQTMSIRELNNIIESSFLVNAHDQILVLGSKFLDDPTRTLEFYSVRENDHIRLLPRPLLNQFMELMFLVESNCTTNGLDSYIELIHLLASSHSINSIIQHCKGYVPFVLSKLRPYIHHCIIDALSPKYKICITKFLQDDWENYCTGYLTDSLETINDCINMIRIGQACKTMYAQLEDVEEPAKRHKSDIFESF